MGGRVVFERVDLSKHPQKNDTTLTQVTLGDLHSNAMKLLHTLVRYGVCEFRALKFRKLSKLYDLKNPTEADKQAFLALFREEFKVKNTDILVRLIGDIVADRGQNDLYVLTILDVLREKGVRVSTLISNHDVDLIRAYEAYKKKGGVFGQSGTATIASDFTRSIQVLEKSIGDGKAISSAEFERLMEETYLPSLKLIDYSLSEDAPKKITIFSHAPIDLEVIEQMANKFGVVYKAETVEALAQTMDAINQKFIAYVREGHFDVIYNPSKIIDSGRGMVKQNCIEYTAWNRDEDLKSGSESILSAHIEFVYGHTVGGVCSRENITKIDNKLGKGDDHNDEFEPLFVADDPIPTLPLGDGVLKPAEYLSTQVLEENHPVWIYKKQHLLGLIKDNKARVEKLFGLEKERVLLKNKYYLEQVDTYNHLLALNIEVSSEEELNQFNTLLLSTRRVFVDDLFIKTVQDALYVLKKYAAGTAVSELIEDIESDLGKENFKSAQEKIKDLEKNSFEGLGGQQIDAEKRGGLEKAWYQIIAGIRFFLSCMMSLFTKKPNHENSWAKSLLGRPFFFQKPTTQGEDALILKQLELLEQAKNELKDVMGVGDSPTFSA
ncbi:MAG: hypothetical protein P1U61_03635 [Legionellaceae bacterium]|nr:hypothetical protein [Legionellaceae bacterium]